MQITAKDLTMQFDDAGRVVEVFNSLSLEIKSGTSVAITGESGVGKTTLLYILGALETPISGEVWIGESCLTARDKKLDIAAFRGQNIGFVFQFHYLFQEFNALENVAMPLLIQGAARGQAMNRAESLLKRVGLGHRLTHRPGALSGGEQQRVAIARALVTKPGVILADEPTGNLDLKTGGEITKLLLEMQQEEGVTLAVVTHSPDVAGAMSRVVELTPQGIMDKGTGR